MRRFFLPGLLAATVTLGGQDARHIGRVLRLGPGDELVVVGRDGQAARATITGLTADSVTVSLGERLETSGEPPVRVWLAQGLAKGDKMDYIVQKAVELGAAGIIPIAAEFSTVRYDEDKKSRRTERWQKIAGEAAKQCRRNLVPTVVPVRSLQALLDGVGPETTAIMLYEGAGGESLRTILAERESADYLLIIGPEGGFSPAEAALCTGRGVLLATLGPRILRTETAAAAALAVVMYEKGDLGG